ncbi:MAG: FeoB-associated Cys-rich membrane protein [Clostridia bacterium]|nr:FeoB-associated Cys-rich membrane protein [Clostridia bacterium]MBR2875369.1 FeoB-associated Cys-rich membrane protein [Clostridia bacterium]
MENYIIIGVILVIVALAFLYLYKAKKKGKKCIGCPYCDQCSKKQCDSNENKD